MPQALPNLTRNCEWCGTSFSKYVPPSRVEIAGRFCSLACSGARRRADDSPNALRTLLLARMIERDNGCREWTGPRKPDGYGVVTVRGKTYAVHRLAYELWVGLIPEGECVLHRCDNPPCFQLAHLFPGTKRDNNLDRDAKGRKFAILTEDDVRQIRSRLTGKYGNQSALAREFGVHLSTLNSLAKGRSWRGVT